MADTFDARRSEQISFAIGVLMERYSATPDEAAATLTVMSSAVGIGVHDCAVEVIGDVLRRCR